VKSLELGVQAARAHMMAAGDCILPSPQDGSQPAAFSGPARPVRAGTVRPLEVRRSRSDETVDPQTAARLEVYVTRERAGLIEDFRKQPPDVILVDNQDRDWGSWAHADPELSALLKPYTPVRTINGVDILQRTNEARS
jgi:hypothetical protein